MVARGLSEWNERNPWLIVSEICTLKGCGELRLSLHTFSVQNHNVINQACRATRSTPGDSPSTPFGVLSKGGIRPKVGFMCKA